MKIRNSVGRCGINKERDVRIVQTLLNRHVMSPDLMLKVDGKVGRKTVTAICVFQYRLGMKRPDGLISPSGRTFNALNTLPYSVPLTEICFNMFNNITNRVNGIVQNMVSGAENKLSAIWEIRLSDINLPVLNLPASPSGAIAWGAKVSPQFKTRVIEICEELEINPDFLMTCMAFESGETFRADQRNLGGGSAIGLIQFTRPAIDELNRKYGVTPPLTRARLAAMTNVEQLEYVRLYFLGYKGRLNTMEDVYMVILAPAAVGSGPDGTVYRADDARHPEYYEANSGLDRNHNGVITVQECSVVLVGKYRKGLSAGYFG